MMLIPGGQWLNIQPRSFGTEQILEADALASELGTGVRMEIHSMHTEFFADPEVPVGKVWVWLSKTYKGMVEPVTMLESADQPFDIYEWM